MHAADELENAQVERQETAGFEEGAEQQEVGE